MSSTSFSTLETLFENDYARLQKGKYENQFYLFKRFKDRPEDPAASERIAREATIVAELYPKQGKLLEEQETPVLTMPFFGGITLQDFIRNWSFDLREFLETAILLAGKIGEVHQKNIIHLNINPAYIFYDVGERAMAFVDYSHARFFQQKNLLVSQNERAAYDLHYISPEQTGRINRPVDFSSDLYSCGVVLFELATGAKLFGNESPLELVHNHIAKLPPDPALLNDQVSGPISAILLKLLAKDPEDRYQSYHGLLHDLQKCLRQLQKTDQIKDFPLGLEDVNDKFRLPAKIYGRSRELFIFEQALAATDKGERKVLFVGGPSGIGKSSLLASFRKNVEASKGIFLQGKFDQLGGHLPYSAWSDMFNSFMEWIITEDTDRIDHWKKLLEKRLGSNIPYLAQLISNLHWLFDDIQEETLAFRSDSQNRILYAILEFVRCISESGFPFVIFIDDWQWADTASIELLNNFLQDESIHHLLFIAAYRDDEIDQEHPFSKTLENLARTDQGSLLAIDNISENDALQLLQDTLNVRSEDLQLLNRLIYARTEGNLLYYTQFLSALRDENIIRFDAVQRSWVWDLEAVRNSILSDDIVKLMIKKIRRYDPAEQQLLQLASCVSNTFRLHTLSLAGGLSIQATEKLLISALADGLLGYVAQSTAYKDGREIELKFAHDRIQQSLYDMLSREEKERHHFQIGRVFLDRWPAERIQQNIFAITEQLNKGVALIGETEQLLKIAVFNWQCSQKAKTLADFDNAFRFSRQSINILEAAGVHHKPDLYIDLYLHTYELAYLLGRADEVQAREEMLNQMTLSPHQRAKFANIKVDGLIMLGDLARAVDVGLEALREHGFNFKKNPGKVDIIAAAILMQLSYKQKKIDELINLPVITDPLLLTLFRIVQSVNGAAYFSNNNLWVFMNIKTMGYYLKKGLCPLAGLAASAYGATLIIGSQNIKGGVAFGKLALSIMDKLQPSADDNRILFTYAALINWWKEPARTSMETIQRALQLSLAYGDFQFAGHCTSVISSYTVCLGRYPEHKKQLEYYQNLADSLHDYIAATSISIYRQLFSALADPEGPANSPEDEIYSVASDENYNSFKDHQVVVFTNYSSSLKYHFLMRHYRRAYHFTEKLQDLPNTAYGTYISFHADLFVGLANAAYYRALDTQQQRKVKKELKKLLKKFRGLSRHAPVNFSNKYLLLKGYYLALAGQYPAALEALHQSADRAKEQEFYIEEAIAWEACADLYLEREQNAMARLCIQAAYEIHRDGEALAVCHRLMQRHPWLEEIGPEGPDGLSAAPAAASNALAGLDLRSVLKSSEALIGETDYDKLLEKLILIAIENAGAEKCYLLLKKGNKLEISAFGDVDKHTRIYNEIDSQSFPDISQRVVQYVATSKEVVILENAQNDPKFGSDNYFSHGKVKSVFALPILNKGSFVGLLYFENNRTKKAFTNERVELMKLLSGQIAISIENAVLVENLEEKVKERTRQIQQEKDNSEKLLLNILPKATAEELQLTGQARPRFYDQASVLFLDFQNFSKSRLDYRDLIDNLDAYFKAFDDIIGEFQIEKIKTIGDAYMCASGLPVANDDHAVQLCRAAIGMQQLIKAYKQDRIARQSPYFEARIGIHSGPVIAGVVGSKKFAYDIWGDTVNIASRLETSCPVGAVAVSEATYRLVKDEIECLPQGKIKAKNIGMLEVFHLNC